MKKLTYPLIAFAFAATAAQAQDTQAEQDTAQPATPDASAQEQLPPSDAGAPPADPAAPAASAATASSVTDAEVSSYAEAATKVQKIAQDASLPDEAKQQQMASAVTEAGLQPQRFNEISKAIGADPELRARIQTALAAHSGGQDG